MARRMRFRLTALRPVSEARTGAAGESKSTMQGMRQMRRVVRPRGGPVSWLVMHLPVKLSATLPLFSLLSVCAGSRMQAQDSSSQQPHAATPTQSSSAQGQASADSRVRDLHVRRSAGQGALRQPLGPVAGVGLRPHEGGADAAAGVEPGRAGHGRLVLADEELGDRGVGARVCGHQRHRAQHDGPNGRPIKGPMVKQYFFVGGAEWLGPHNKHGALIAHAMFGGVYGNFQKDLLGQPPADFDFYYNQIAPAAIVGGHFDLNRSEHWVFRITPDAVMTHYTFSDAPHSSASLRAIRRELRHLAWGWSTSSPRSSGRPKRRTGFRAGR